MKKSIQAIVQIPLKDLQTEKAKSIDVTVSHCCIICGKKLNEGESYRQVQLMQNGNIISCGDDVEGSQGFFPVGNECASKLVINFTFDDFPKFETDSPLTSL